MPLVGDGSDISGGGPFQANTRIVAIIALTVAGVFVILGLGLSLLRALQQKAAERQLALAAQLQLAQDNHADGLGTTEVERTNSSKVPWLVVGPDGIELAIAHKVRVAPPTNLSDQDASKSPLPINADPTTETIQAVHWDPNSSPTFDQPLHVSQQQPNAPFVVSSAPVSSISAAHSNNAAFIEDRAGPEVRPPCKIQMTKNTPRVR
ncbi:MAG: hypothetical protein FRX49_06446 [Trebouxia sp. A1-2]|nr:MAG: hypothetical protein FRX49_06446 [Trebouxia sp. A1-2]